MLVILVDCKNLCTYNGGISGFFKPLLSLMIKNFKDIHFILVAHQEFNTEFISDYNNWALKIVPYYKTGVSQIDILLYDLLILPKALKNENAQILVSPYYDFIVPKKYKNSSLITVHDMCYWDLKKEYPRKLRWYYKFLLNYNITQVSKIVTVSKSSFERLNSIFGTNVARKCSVIYNTFDVSNSLNEKKNSLKLDKEKYLLYTGGFEGRKNVEMMFDAFSDISKSQDVKLIFTGDFTKNKKLINLIKKYDIESSVVLTGLLTSYEIEQYYISCDVVINLSLYEGFGRSNLEAVKYHKPLVCSDIKVFKELVGTYAIFCNPFDRISIIKAIQKSLISDSVNKNVSLEKFSLNYNSSKFNSLIKDMINEG